MWVRPRTAAHARSVRGACAAGGLGILVASLLAGCGPQELEPIAFESLASGSPPAPEAGPTSLAYQTIADSGAWSEFWQRSFATPLPEVHFEGECILRVEWGPKPTGGYAIEIRDVALDHKSGTLHVGLDLREPSPDDMVTQMLTAPFAVVRVRVPPHGSLAVRFSRLAGTKRQQLEARRLDGTEAQW